MFLVSSGALAPPAAAVDPAVTITNHVVPSFDGTPLEVTLFVPDGASASSPVPLVLRGHGFAEHRQRTLDGGAGGFAVLVAAGFSGMLPELVRAGYAVLTWDARGFGCSGGEAQLDDPEVEGRDVSALIDWAAANAPIAFEAPGDPVVGMTGESYGGGVQLAAASRDPRIDALVPTMTWSDLEYAAFPGGVAKLFTIALIVAAGSATGTVEGLDPTCLSGPQTGSVSPTLATLGLEAIATDQIPEALRAYTAARSLTGYGAAHPVAIPTLAVEGSTDTIFPIRQGLGIYEHVRAQGAPAKLLVTCGGHGTCSQNYIGGTDFPYMFDTIVRWFDRHLKGDTSVDTGPPVEYHSNTGEWRRLSRPDPPDAISAAVQGAVVTVPVLDPVDPVPFLTRLLLDGEVDASKAPYTAAQVSDAGDPRAMTVPLAEAGETPIRMFGLPTVHLTISGTGGPTTNLYVKLVDRELSEVVNLQEGVVRAPVGPVPASVDVTMPGVAYTLEPGHHLDLQIATHSNLHAMSRYASLATLTASVTIPVERMARHGTPVKRLLVKHSPSGTRRVLYEGRSAGGSVVGNPAAAGSTFRLQLTSGGTQCFSLPASGWRAVGTQAYRYRDPSLANGPVSAAQVTVSSSGTLQIKVIAKGAGTAVTPGDPTTGYASNFRIMDGDEYCSSTGSATPAPNDATTFRVVNDTGTACTLGPC